MPGPTLYVCARSEQANAATSKDTCAVFRHTSAKLKGFPPNQSIASLFDSRNAFCVGQTVADFRPSHREKEDTRRYNPDCQPRIQAQPTERELCRELNPSRLHPRQSR